jgi:hypothetical protein
LLKAGLPAELADAVLELIVASAEGRLGAGLYTQTVEAVTGRPARGFDDWARDHVHLFR